MRERRGYRLRIGATEKGNEERKNSEDKKKRESKT